jgi:XTP/dITP diphosphohydrolase
MHKLLIATGNRGKVKELRTLLTDLDLELLIPADIGLAMDVVEDGKTFAENAGKKARQYCEASGLLALADDSGLLVDALDGAPGLYSARYSPMPGATDADRRAYMLKNLTGKPRPWNAHFHATIAIAHPDGRMFFTEGNCFGEIIPEERGDNGFGYDPIFYIPEMQRTMAELSLKDKNRLSHRAVAVISAIPILQTLLQGKK